MKPPTFWAKLVAVETVSARRRSVQHAEEESGQRDFTLDES
jgi:hypothetical protein